VCVLDRLHNLLAVAEGWTVTAPASDKVLVEGVGEQEDGYGGGGERPAGG
jgi:hypothetical protein